MAYIPDFVIFVRFLGDFVVDVVATVSLNYTVTKNNHDLISELSNLGATSIFI